MVANREALNSPMPADSPADVSPSLTPSPQITVNRFDGGLGPRKWVMETSARRERCHAVLLQAGQATATLRHGTLAGDGPALLWLPVGEGRGLEVSAGARGYFLSVPDDVIARHLSQLAPVETMVLAPEVPLARGAAPDGGLGLRFVADTVHGVDLQHQPDNLRVAEHAFGVIANEVRSNQRGAGLVIGAQMLAVLTIIARLAEDWMDHRHPHGSGSVTLQRFLHVLETHFREHWNVANYATALATSEKRLASATLRATGKPPLHLIHDRVIHEACLRLEQSPLAVAQIAYGLGFRDPAYFSRFFKRYTAMAPGAWRRQKRARQRPDDTSFAAWP
ncbi:helix-turn-helix domain-containing protein [Thalassospira mesophila]|uniref:helix-turn-helix domain-containing protein n=1 Tax=Thalassospira mesophila TaxID=1293891 RepID=UPI000A1E021A|nr:helix-turn-helix domain-containing protein [Thalassospira mesophila]